MWGDIKHISGNCVFLYCYTDMYFFKIGKFEKL